ncbi:DUF819 family protein [Robiginitalea sp. M366]|uniref:DUF819 family protein n=1 Tax=Robiginitalea aestuariiviva TaxID=3036903 RepID=UPI00240D42B5|nr:DUF819 family protein [Robiginitalea aestuariiviva]MDG1573440.1 DUF819 family protein [Robiginitalea aestuariiviva]
MPISAFLISIPGIDTEHPVYLVTALALVLYLSYRFSQHKVFRAFGMALLAIIFGAVASNLGLIPSQANPTYNAIFEIVAPAALFLLLLDANLSQLRKTGLPILVLFLAGSLGTVAGVVGGMWLIGDSPLFEGLYAPLGGMFTGTYTGGSINFNAVALEYGVMDNGLVYTSAVAADNVLTTLWFFATITLPVLLQRWMPRQQVDGVATSGVPADTTPALRSDEAEHLNLGSLSLWIVLAGAALLLSEAATAALASIGLAIPFMLVLTTLALLLAQVPAVHRFRGNMFLGSWAVYLFLAVVGAFCDIGALVAAGQLALLLLAVVLIAVLLHGAITFGLAALLGYDWELAAIASQANVGGGTSAMALAKNFGRDALILPAIIIGSLGNALGTYLGFLVAGLL